MKQTSCCKYALFMGEKHKHHEVYWNINGTQRGRLYELGKKNKSKIS
jgi:hypothetical protein